MKNERVRGWEKKIKYRITEIWGAGTEGGRGSLRKREKEDSRGRENVIEEESKEERLREKFGERLWEGKKEGGRRLRKRE